MESILSQLKNCMVFLRIIPVKKVDEVHRIVYNTESAERISVTVHMRGEMHSSQNTHPPCQSAE